MKSFAYGECAITRNRRELGKGDGFCIIFVRDGIAKKGCCGALYVKDVAEEIRKQVGFCGKMIICTFRRRETAFHDMIS